MNQDEMLGYHLSEILCNLKQKSSNFNSLILLTAILCISIYTKNEVIMIIAGISCYYYLTNVRENKASIALDAEHVMEIIATTDNGEIKERYFNEETVESPYLDWPSAFVQGSGIYSSIDNLSNLASSLKSGVVPEEIIKEREKYYSQFTSSGSLFYWAGKSWSEILEFSAVITWIWLCLRNII